MGEIHTILLSESHCSCLLFVVFVSRCLRDCCCLFCNSNSLLVCCRSFVFRPRLIRLTTMKQDSKTRIKNMAEKVEKFHENFQEIDDGSTLDCIV